MARPGNLHVGAAWPGGIELDWTGGDGGLVHIQLSSVGSDYYDVAVVDGGLHHASADTMLAFGLTYAFRAYGADYADQNPSAVSNTVLYGAPADPSDLISSVISASEVDLAWTDNSGGRAAYVIEMSSDWWATSSTLATLDAGQSSYAAQNLNANTTYYFRVTATAGGFNSMGWNVAALTAPNAPSDLQVVSAGFGTATLFWINNTDNLWGTQIEASADGGATYMPLDTVTGDATRDTVTGLLHDTSYTFRIHSYNGTYSEYSNVVTGTNAWAAPSDLTATAISDQEIDLTWSAPAGLNGSLPHSIYVYRSTAADPSGSFAVSTDTLIATGAGDSTFHDTTVQSGTTYYYRVTAVSITDGLESDASEAANATTSPVILTPGPTQGFSSLINVPLDPGTVVGRFSDDNPSDDAGAFSATIDWGDAQSSTGMVQADPSQAGSFIVTDQPGGTHTYNTLGTDDVTTSITGPGSSALDLHSIATVLPGSPTELAAATVSDREIDLAWSAPVGLAAEGAQYNLYRSTTDGFAISDAPPIATGIGDTSYHDTTAQSGTTYYYRVTAVSSGGLESDASEIANDTTAAPTLTAGSPNTLYGTAGLAIDPTTVIAHFTDDNANDGAANFANSIDWGDGSTPDTGTLVASGDGFDVLGGHAYAVGGSQSIGVNIEGAGAQLDAPATALIADAAITTQAGDALTGTEGTSLDDVVIARFSDPNPFAGAGDFSATLNWGDGSDVNADGTPSDSPDLAGYVQADPTLANTFDVLGSHAYAHAGTFNLSAAINDDAGADAVGGPSTATASDSATATINRAALSLTLMTINPQEGGFFNNVIARFRDPNLLAKPSDFTATLTWTRNHTNPGGGHETISDPGETDFTRIIATPTPGLFEVVAGYVVVNNDPTQVTVDIKDAADSSTRATATAAVPIRGSSIRVTAAPVDGLEGETLADGTVVATFTDTNGLMQPGDYTATLDWGTGQQTATVSADQNNSQPGHFQVTTDGIALGETGSHFFTIMVKRGTHTSISTGNIAVQDAPLSASAPDPLYGSALDSYRFHNVLLASFSDAAATSRLSDFGATVSWGDGQNTSAILIQTGPQTYGVYGTHTYTVDNGSNNPDANNYGAGEHWAYHVHIEDKDGAQTNSDGSVSIGESVPGDGYNDRSNDQDLTYGGGVLPTPYNPAGSGGGDGSGVDSNPDPTNSDDETLSVQGTSETATEGELNNGQPPAFVLATFNLDSGESPDPGDYTATVSFTDSGFTVTNVQIQAVEGDDSQLEVTAQCTVPEEGNHIATVTVNSNNDAFGSGTVHSVISVADARLNVENSTISGSVESGQRFTLDPMTSFIDTNPNANNPSDYAVNIYWGDGTVSSTDDPNSEVTVTRTFTGHFTISGTHTYPASGSDTDYDVKVTILDADGDPNADSGNHSYEVINGTLTATAGAFPMPALKWHGYSQAASQDPGDEINDDGGQVGMPTSGMQELDLSVTGSYSEDSSDGGTRVTLSYEHVLDSLGHPGTGDVRVWAETIRGSGIYVQILGSGTPGGDTKEYPWSLGQQPEMVWVEGIAASSAERDVAFSLRVDDSADVSQSGDGGIAVDARGARHTRGGGSSTEPPKALADATIDIAQAAVDGNRDGIITFDAKDVTTFGSPYQFWLNNNHDVASSGGETLQEGPPDSGAAAIETARDLQDWSQIAVKPPLDFMNDLRDNIGVADWQITMQWKRTVFGPTIGVHYIPSMYADYLYNEPHAGGAMAYYGQKIIVVRGDGAIDVTPKFLGNPYYSGVLESGQISFLFDGITRGKGELTVSFNKLSTGTTVGSSTVVLDLKRV